MAGAQFGAAVATKLPGDTRLPTPAKEQADHKSLQNKKRLTLVLHALQANMACKQLQTQALQLPPDQNPANAWF